MLNMIPENLVPIVVVIVLLGALFALVPKFNETSNVIHGWWRQSRATLTEEAKKLLVEAANGDGDIAIFETSGPLTEIQASGQVLAKTKDARLASKWRAAVEELEEGGNIAVWGEGTFRVTDKGYEFVEKL